MILLTEGFSPFTTMLGLLPALALLAWPLGRGVHTVTIGWLAAADPRLALRADTPAPDALHERGSALDIDASSPTLHPELTGDDDDASGGRPSGSF